jgi:2,4'-dihydroxyacetophenone dioxygenase
MIGLKSLSHFMSHLTSGSSDAVQERTMLYENIEASCFSDESLPWLPMGLGGEAQVKYFRCDPIRGELIALLKAPSTVKLPRHHHSGTVIIYTLKGKWKYKEHDWVAGPGSVVYETAASTHTPEALPEGGPEVVALNVISGDLVYYDESDKVIMVSNWRTALGHYLDHCRKAGVEPIDITGFR